MIPLVPGPQIEGHVVGDTLVLHQALESSLHQVLLVLAEGDAALGFDVLPQKAESFRTDLTHLTHPHLLQTLQGQSCSRHLGLGVAVGVEMIANALQNTLDLGQTLLGGGGRT